MREMKQSGIEWLGEIPKDWKICPLWVICSHASSNISQQELFDIDNGEFPIFGASGLIKYVDFFRQEKPCLGIVKDGAGVGNVYLLPKQSSVIGTMAYIISKNKINLKFLFYLFLSMNIKPNNVSTTIPHIYFSSYGKIKVPYISEETQAAIVNYLNNKCIKLDSLIENEEKVISELKKYKKSIIQKATTKGISKCELKDSGVEWIKEIPTHWEVIRISGIYKIRNTKVSDKDYQPLSVGYMGVVPQLENAAKTNDGDNRKLVMKNDFVINSRADRRGACGISNFDGSVSLINIVLQPLKGGYNNYFEYLFKSTSFSDEFYRWGNGIVDDLWSTKWSEMKRILIPNPPILEQKAIAKYLDKKIANVDKTILIKQQKIAELKEYKKTLIYEYVTGKKEVV
jgi:type I restriction enzyme S subunit